MVGKMGSVGAWNRWFDENVLELVREFRISYLPPLMVYLAAGISGLTGIVGTFFVKDYLGLSAEFLAGLAFWAGIPWALKMPLGHLVDLLWRYKSLLVFLGAGLVAASLLIMIGLLANAEAMRRIMPVDAWYVLSALLAPVGYVLQDVVADAMTVEAVPRVDAAGKPIAPETERLMHTTMQTLGRVAIITGGILVALLNVWMFAGVESMATGEKAEVYVRIYGLALTIPLVSVLGVILGGVFKVRELRRLTRLGMNRVTAWRTVTGRIDTPRANWWILGGSLVFVGFTVTTGVADVPYNQEIILAGSLAIVVFLMSRLVNTLELEARRTLVGTAIIIFVFRAVPGTGAGSSWWMIDELGFDQRFLSILALVGSSLALVGMFVLRRFMAERSIAYVVGFLTIVGTVLMLPNIGLYYGLHHWTSGVTDGVVDARFIAIIDTALESPLGQIAMIPMLAWIAHSAPPELKATYFAVLASFTNLALSLSQLLTRYLNSIFVVSREVLDPATGAMVVAADYSELGMLLIAVAVIALVLPMTAIILVRGSGMGSA